MIDAIIFDIGGVLVQTTDLTPRQRWEKRLGLPDWGLASAVFDSAPSQRAFVGAADAADVWAHIKTLFGLNAGEISQLARDFWAGDSLNAKWISQIAALQRHYKTAILSNGWRDMRDRDQQRIDMSGFDAVVYSCDERMRKPHVEIYVRTVARLGIPPERALFIDDMPENIAAARAAGLQARQYVAGMPLAID